MEKRKKIVICCIAIFILLVLMLILIFKNRDSEQIVNYSSNINMSDLKNAKIKNGEKYNKSKIITKEHKYEDKYSIDNMEIYTDNGMCYLEFELKNLSDIECNTGECYLILNFYSDNKKTFLNFVNFTIPKLKAGESKKMKLEHPLDFTTAYDYEIIM